MDAQTQAAVDDDRFRHLVFQAGLHDPAPPARRATTPRPAASLFAPSARHTQLLSAPQMRFLSEIFHLRHLDLGRYRAAPLLRRIPALLRKLRVATLDEALRLIRCNPALADTAINSLLIGTTRFFRHEPTFRELEHAVLPSLLARPGALRAWSAGCSIGAELYSLAMLLLSAGALERSFLLGTDCRPEAIAQARSGVYPASDGDELPTILMPTCFSRTAGMLIMSSRLRRSVQWQVADLLQPGELGSWDLILCRNLAIYLEPPQAALLWSRLAAALTPGGILVVGKAERPGVTGLVRAGTCIYRKE